MTSDLCKHPMGIGLLLPQPITASCKHWQRGALTSADQNVIVDYVYIINIIFLSRKYFKIKYSNILFHNYYFKTKLKEVQTMWHNQKQQETASNCRKFSHVVGKTIEITLTLSLWAKPRIKPWGQGYI